MTKASKKWELVKMELGERANEEGTSKSGGSPTKKKAGAKVGEKTKTNLEAPPPAFGVVNKPTPLIGVR